MNLVNMWILCALFLSTSDSQKLEQLNGHSHSHCHHLPVIKSHSHYSSIIKKTFTSTKSMGRAHFLAKALYGVNLCLQPKYGQVYFPFDRVHFPSLKSKPLLYYPMIIDRVINRKPIILPQTFQQIGKILPYLTKMRNYLTHKLNIGNSTYTPLPIGAKNVTCEQQSLKYLYRFQKSRFYRKLKALVGLFIPICIIKILHGRQTAREKAMCGNTAEFIRLAKKTFYQTTRHNQYQHRHRQHHHRHHHHHHHHHHHCCCCSCC